MAQEQKLQWDSATLDVVVITTNKNGDSEIKLESNKIDFDFLFKYHPNENNFIIERKWMQIMAQDDKAQTNAKLATDMNLKQLENTIEYKGENIEKYTIDENQKFAVMLHLKNGDQVTIQVRNSKFRFNQIIKWVNAVITKK